MKENVKIYFCLFKETWRNLLISTAGALVDILRKNLVGVAPAYLWQVTVNLVRLSGPERTDSIHLRGACR